MLGCSCEVYKIQTLLGPLSYQKSNYGLGRYWIECLTNLYAARIPNSAPHKSRVVDHTCNPSTGGGGWSQVDEFKVIHSLLYSKLKANGVRETLSLMGV